MRAVGAIRRLWQKLLASRRSALALLLTLASRVLAALGGLAFSMIVARIGGASGLGIVSSTIAALLIVSLILRGGTDQSLIRFAAQMRLAGTPWLAMRFFLQSLGLCLMVSSVVALGLNFAAIPLLLDGTSRDLAGVLVWALPGLTLVNIASGFLKGQRASAIAALGEIGAISGVSAIGIAIIGASSLTEAAGLFVYVTSAMALVAIAAAWILHRRGNRGGRDDPYAPSESEHRFASLAASGWPFLVIGLSLLATQSGSMALGALSLSEDELGYVRAAERLALLVSFALTAVNPFVAPRIVAAWKTGGTAQVLVTYRKAVIASVAFALPIAAGLVLFGQFALRQFGNDFTVAYPILLIMLVGQLVHAAMGSLTMVLTMTGQEHTAMWIALLTLVFGLIALPLGSAVAGAAGFAAAYSATMVLRETLLYWRVQLFLRRH
jgi:O-antigen/teichoic acid export membrane protein